MVDLIFIDLPGPISNLLIEYPPFLSVVLFRF